MQFPLARHVCWFCAACLMSATGAAAEPSSAKPGFSHTYQRGKIRIFYDLSGPDAVDPADVDQSGTPDQVEDIFKQIWAAYTLFVETLGFPDPFRTARFGSAVFLDIHLLGKARLHGNGVAFDELQTFRRPSDPPATKSLCFNVSTAVKAHRNLTPAHELFHLIQYGASYFKNAWYSEGMARWSESALGLGGIGKVSQEKPWSLSAERQAVLFDMSYQAAVEFWNPLALAVDPVGQIPAERVNPCLRRLTYSTGAKVLADLRLHGWEFMRDLLGELGKADRAAWEELRYDRWSEKNQNAPENSRFIYQAVRDVLRNRSRAMEELLVPPADSLPKRRAEHH